MNFEGEKIELTEAERIHMNKGIDEVERQIADFISSLGGSSREWSLALTKMEESAMWMRKAVERM